MNSADFAMAIYLTFLTTGVSALFWARMNRLDARMDRLDARMDRLETRIEGVAGQTTGLAEQMASLPGLLVTKDDWAAFRREMQDGFQRSSSEMAIMRSDLTHVALAVGAKPRASEG